MIQNAHITVVTSRELTAMRLDDLVGRGFSVVEVLAEDCIKNHGALVLLKEPYLGDHPYVDIRYQILRILANSHEIIGAFIRANEGFFS